jgi:CrcB protein
MGATGYLAVGFGAAIGATLRWFLGARLNALWPYLPPGTLAANLLGGYLIGVAIGLIDRAETLPPEVRLFVVTGFLGGLTTFSTFSAEVVTQFGRGEIAWGLAAIGIHVIGSLALTGLGFATMHLLLGG